MRVISTAWFAALIGCGWVSTASAEPYAGDKLWPQAVDIGRGRIPANACPDYFAAVELRQLVFALPGTDALKASRCEEVTKSVAVTLIQVFDAESVVKLSVPTPEGPALFYSIDMSWVKSDADLAADRQAKETLDKEMDARIEANHAEEKQRSDAITANAATAAIQKCVSRAVSDYRRSLTRPSYASQEFPKYDRPYALALIKNNCWAATSNGKAVLGEAMVSSIYAAALTAGVAAMELQVKK